jgi:hypothetical protein
MKSLPAMFLTAALCVFAISETARVAPVRDHTVQGTVVGELNGQGEVGIEGVRVRCLGTDGSAHDDVRRPLTDARGRFVLGK